MVTGASGNGTNQRHLVAESCSPALLHVPWSLSYKLQGSVSASDRNIKAKGWKTMANGDTWNRFVQEESQQSGTDTRKTLSI